MSELATFPVIEAVSPSSRPLAGQLRRLAETAALVSLDVLAVALSFAAAASLRLGVLPYLSSAFAPQLPPGILGKIGWFALLVPVALAYEGLYTGRYSFWQECGRLVKALCLAFVFALAVITLTKTTTEVSRTLVVLAWLFALLFLPAVRYGGKHLLARLGLWRRRVLVLGAGRTGLMILQALCADPYLGYQVVGFLDDDPRKKHCIWSGSNQAEVRVLGGFKDAGRVMRETGVYNLIVAVPGLTGRKLVALVNSLQTGCESILVVPDLFGLPVLGAEADYFFHEQILGLRIKNNLASPVNAFLKRAFDLAVGSIILLLVSPVMLLVAGSIKLDSPGPVFYISPRLGRGGRPFNCYKFRTMHLDNETILQAYLQNNHQARQEWEKYRKIKGSDPRVTRVGRFLRRTSLDELPQLFNVLRGEMSLVGPRPYLLTEADYLTGYQDTILLTPPGITGLWQVSGRNKLKFAERIRLEAWYVRNWSLWMDITLLVRTLPVPLKREGAY
ncbi:MAG: undecaprenyl-phosphate galactose phosphotransferase WbaP [Desulfurispora sp.]|uniref:undecaprenyl-phosphate galactose phosphotransferase WbaP n=1 Tax=Desulfurispora sp. TaxID=3014275 RepID=UPI00404952CD